MIDHSSPCEVVHRSHVFQKSSAQCKWWDHLPTAPPRESNPANAALLAPATPNAPAEEAEADVAAEARQQQAAVMAIPFMLPSVPFILGDLLYCRASHERCAGGSLLSGGERLRRRRRSYASLSTGRAVGGVC